MKRRFAKRCVGCGAMLLLALGGTVLAADGKRPGPAEARGWWVEVEGAPAAEVWALTFQHQDKAAAKAATKAHLDGTAKARAKVRGAIATKTSGSVVELYEAGRVLNGIAVIAAASDVEAIRRIDGVVGVHPLPRHERDLTSSVPFLGMPAVWEGVDGHTGEGIRIGIIDTGIDYIHRAFGGSGTAYAQNDGALVGDIPDYPGVRVVGGTDLVGDDYDANSDDPEIFTGVPDPDPMDCDGHGTHVASIAAGSGVTALGETFTGPFDGSVPFGTMMVGPGVAPRASLYAIRVFGCDGSTDYVVQALEWASDPDGDGDFTDRLDVVNMSLGSPFGRADGADSLAVDALSLLGTIVVMSAGNSGDTAYITGSPGVAKRGISVASSVDSGLLFDELRIGGPDGALLLAAPSAFGPGPGAAGVTAELVAAMPATACTGALSNDVIGKIVLIDRGTCAFASKVFAAQLSGAVGVVLVDLYGLIPDFPGGTGDTVTIPSAMVSKADGEMLKALLAGGSVTVTLRRGEPGSAPTGANLVSNFSSRGPETGTHLLKPDVAAPGSSILAAGVFTGTGTISLGGTSMAAPHVAGMMALLRGQRPDWSVAALKALAMSTANTSITSQENGGGTRYSVVRVGSGRVEPATALASRVYVTNDSDDGTVSLSFGIVEATDFGSASRQALLVNNGTEVVTYSAHYIPDIDLPGVEVILPGEPITAGPGESVPFTVEVTVNVAQLDKVIDPTMGLTQPAGGVPTPRNYPMEEAGIIALASMLNTPQSPNLRLALHVAPRPVSKLQAGPDAIRVNGGSGTALVPVTGETFDMGGNFPSLYPLDSVAMTFPFELLHESPLDPELDGAMRNVDLHMVGFRLNPAESFGDSVLQFAIVAHAPWGSPSEVYYLIEFDFDGDDVGDAGVYTTNLGYHTGGGAIDSFVSVAYQAEQDGVVNFYTDYFGVGQFDTNQYGTNTLIVSALAKDLGLTSPPPGLRYSAVAYQDSIGAYGEITDWMPLNLESPGLGGSNIAYFAKPGDTIDATYTRRGLRDRGVEKVLMLHKHNAAGTNAQTIPIEFDRNAVWMLY